MRQFGQTVRQAARAAWGRAFAKPNAVIRYDAVLPGQFRSQEHGFAHQFCEKSIVLSGEPRVRRNAHAPKKNQQGVP